MTVKMTMKEPKYFAYSSHLYQYTSVVDSRI